MTKDKQKLAYKDWEPVISAEEVYSEVKRLEEIKVVGEKIYWLESKPAEGARMIIAQRKASGEIVELTPREFYVKSSVHEYGGGAFAVNEESLYFVNMEDQRIYHQSLMNNNPPNPITLEKNADGSLGKYGSLELSPSGKTLLFVYEKDFSDKENENFIAAINLESEELVEPTILAKGNDFYSTPIVSPDGKKIAWLTWIHPHMPWDYTELILADFDEEKLSVANANKVAGGESWSVCGPKFDAKGKLYFIMDKQCHEDSPENWWNIYRYSDDEIQVITSQLAEFGYPHWVFGISIYTFVGENQLIGRYIIDGKEKLVSVDLTNLKVTPIDSPYSGFAYLQTINNKEIVFRTTSPVEPDAIVKFSLDTFTSEVLRNSAPAILSREDISVPEQIPYPTADGQKAYGLLYLPKNKNYEAPTNDKPALIVRVHGGPTGRAKHKLDLKYQFWTSQGFAILDVDYRGSTGYGRIYRDALLGQWGLIDAYDVRDGVHYLQKKGIVSEKAVISGGSAGGYAVQRCLTLFPDLFQCGASYYGIGNLITLVNLIHKFESRYIDKLVGGTVEENEQLYKERSPINFIDQLKAPMILFQGIDDKVVPPEVSREVARILEEKKIEYEYIEYEGEAHGFRKKETNIDALTREAAFFKRILFD